MKPHKYERLSHLNDEDLCHFEGHILLLEVLSATHSLQSQVPCFSIYIYFSNSSLILINKVYVLGFL